MCILSYSLRKTRGRQKLSSTVVKAIFSYLSECVCVCVRVCVCRMEACGMSSPKESANQRTTSLFGRPSYKSLTLPLQELATLFSQPLTSTKPEPMEQATPSPPSEQPSSVHVEICQAPMSTLRASQMHELVRGYLMRAGALRDSVDTEFSDTVLSEHVISITITDVPTDKVCTARKCILPYR